MTSGESSDSASGGVYMDSGGGALEAKGRDSRGIVSCDMKGRGIETGTSSGREAAGYPSGSCGIGNGKILLSMKA
jgi:hypothetical protein